MRRRYILCYNPREAERQRKHRDQVVKELEEELGSHPDHRATAKWAIELMASGRYKRYLAIDRKDCVRLDRAAIREIAKYDGKWVLQTNDDTISLEDAASGYMESLATGRVTGTSGRYQFPMVTIFLGGSASNPVIPCRPFFPRAPVPGGSQRLDPVPEHHRVGNYYYHTRKMPI